MGKRNDKPINLREKLSLLILITIAEMIVKVLDFSDFNLELQGSMRELKDLIRKSSQIEDKIIK